MTAEEIITTIQKNAKVTLSTKERNWLKDNTAKRRLYFDSNHPFIKMDEINTKFHTIIQNGKSRKLGKIDCNYYAIVVSNAGCCKVLLP